MTSRPPTSRSRCQADLAPQSWYAVLRAAARKSVIRFLSAFSRMNSKKEWIILPYYHYVLDDEKWGFAEQLKFMRQHGDFLTLDDAVAAMQQPAGIGGRYFCVTFDDGFRNCFTNALPILVEHKCPAAFFVPTDYIGLEIERDWDVLRAFYERTAYRVPFDFLNWDQCRQMHAARMTIGSHTCSHPRLSEVSRAEAERQLRVSREVIERELGHPCRHFSCTWGRPNIDFDVAVHPEMARQAGYVSFLTTQRGRNYPASSPLFVRRDHALAGDCVYVLRYFFSIE